MGLRAETLSQIQQPMGFRKIVWAVDVLDAPPGIVHQGQAALKCLQHQGGVEVYLAYVLSPIELNLNIEFTPPWIEQYLPAAETALDRFADSCAQAGLKISGQKVLVQHIASIRHAAELLMNHARGVGADGLMVGTHGRSGVARWVLGSFSETLMLESDFPVLIVGGRDSVAQEIRSVLFPTDLSSECQRTLPKVLSLCRQLGARLTVYHSVPNPVEPLVQNGMYLLGGNWVPVHVYFAQDAEEREKKLRQIAENARFESGVDVTYKLMERNGGIADGILDFARSESFDWIALTPESGPISAALIGSINREVVRHSERPVWIIR